MDYQMTKHGKLVVTIDGSETAWENAKTSANGNNVLTSGGYTKAVNHEAFAMDKAAARGEKAQVLGNAAFSGFRLSGDGS